ncbi:MAG: hypothetical protein BWZ10_02039 [candidate division BRC1 bacterium ADurb.BinA364]|nr:MAG: hypothetical protein BWZ10_02039 [candidate division BRC1 bacterium ADurb.BinA364]
MTNPHAIAVLTKRNGLALAAGLALALGWLEGDRALIALSALFAAPLVLGWWYARGLLDRFHASRQHFPRCLEGEALSVELKIWTAERRPVYMLRVEDRFDPSIDSRIDGLIPDPLEPGEEATLAYRQRCDRRRGVYVLGPLRLIASDPLGLFAREREIEAFTELRVAPRSTALERFPVLGRGTHFGVGVETAFRPGPGEEFHELREYRRGDSPHLIHWPSSARAGRLLVKEFNANVSTEAAIFLDLTRLAHTGLGDASSAEYAIRACVAIAEAAIESQHRVGLFLIGRDVEELPFGGGPAQLNEILDRLTLARVSGDLDFLECVGERLHWARRGSTAVFIITATSVNPDEMARFLRHLSSQSVRAIVALIEDRSFLKIWQEQERQQREAAPLESIAETYRLAGADVYELAKDDSVREALSREQSRR